MAVLELAGAADDGRLAGSFVSVCIFEFIIPLDVFAISIESAFAEYFCTWASGVHHYEWRFPVAFGVHSWFVVSDCPAWVAGLSFDVPGSVARDVRCDFCS